MNNRRRSGFSVGYGTIDIGNGFRSSPASSQSVAPPPTPSEPANAFSLDMAGTVGSNVHFVTASHLSAYNVGSQMTLSVWWRSTAGTTRNIVNKWDGVAGQYSFRMTANPVATGLRIFVATNSTTPGTNYHQSVGWSTTVSAWNHAIVIFNTGSIDVYSGSALASTPTIVGSIPASIPNSTAILSMPGPAALGAGNPLSGGIDEVVFLNRAVAPSEVALFRSGTQPSPDILTNFGANVIGWWRMGDGSDTLASLRDRSTNANHATSSGCTIVSVVP